jgi:hypothetical protein
MEVIMFTTVLHTIWDVCFMLLSILLIILGISGDLEAQWLVIVVPLMGWSIWDLRKQIIEIRKRREYDEMKEERDDISKRMEEKEK